MVSIHIDTVAEKMASDLPPVPNFPQGTLDLRRAVTLLNPINDWIQVGFPCCYSPRVRLVECKGLPKDLSEPNKELL